MSIALIIYKSSATADMGDRLATTDIGRGLYLACVRKVRQWGCCAPFRGERGELGPHLTQYDDLGRGLPSYQVASLSIQPFGHNTPTLQDTQTYTANRFTDGRSIVKV